MYNCAKNRFSDEDVLTFASSLVDHLQPTERPRPPRKPLVKLQ
jgi:hypothetical protein